jgi:hypothetical protein
MGTNIRIRQTTSPWLHFPSPSTGVDWGRYYGSLGTQDLPSPAKGEGQGGGETAPPALPKIDLDLDRGLGLFSYHLVGSLPVEERITEDPPKERD